jgi:hypothetical protein
VIHLNVGRVDQGIGREHHADYPTCTGQSRSSIPNTDGHLQDRIHPDVIGHLDGAGEQVGLEAHLGL